MTTVLKRGALLLSGALLVSLSACGGPASNGISSDTPKQAWTAMVGSIKGTKSFEITGQGSYQNFTATLDAKLDVANSAVDVTVGVQGGTVRLWYASKTGYVEVNQTAITLAEQLIGSLGTPITSQEQTSLSQLANKCVNLGASSDSSSPVGAIFGSVSQTSTQAESTPPAGLTKGAVKTVAGQSVLPLTFTETTSGQTVKGELDVATTGADYPVQLTITGSGITATLDFKNWNSVSSISAPSGCVSYTSIKSSLGL